MLFPLTTAAWVQRWDPPILEWWSCLRSFYNSCTLQPSKYWNLLSSMLSSLWSSSGMHVCSGPSLHTIKFVSLVGSLPHQDHHYHPSYSPYHTLLHPVCDVVLDGRVNLESQGMELPLDMLPLSVDVLPLKHIGPHQPLSQQQWGMRRYAHPSLTVHITSPSDESSTCYACPVFRVLQTLTHSITLDYRLVNMMIHTKRPSVSQNRSFHSVVVPSLWRADRATSWHVRQPGVRDICNITPLILPCAH